MSKRKIRVGLTIGLSVVVLLAFIYYITKNEYLIRQLGKTPLSLIAWLLALYAIWFYALALIVSASVRICKKRLGLKENFLLNSYSTLFNFFVPGQGGIAIRGIYLKKNKKLLVKNFVFISLLYYSIYSIISVIFSFSYKRPLWQMALATIAVIAICFLVILLFNNRSKVKKKDFSISISTILPLIVATLLQLVIQAIIFGVELHTVNRSINAHQVLAYTGIANLAVFVALTPGAIGIRESFLVLSHNLHGISNANTVAANIIDRGVFIIFLILLFAVTLAFHAKSNIFVNASVDEEDEIVHDSIDSSANEQ